MKKIMLVCAAMVAVGMLSSCERFAVGTTKYVNNTNHTITIIGNSYRQYHFTLKPNSDTLFHEATGGMDPQSIEEHFMGMIQDGIGIGCKIQYDDGRTIEYSFPTDTALEFSIYNFHASNLSHSLRDNGWISEFVYTLTEDQYETAE